MGETDVNEAAIFLPLPPPPPAMPPCIDPEKMFSTKKKDAPGRNPTPDTRSGNSACWKLRGALGQFCGKTYHPQCPIGSQAGSCTAPTNPESTDDANLLNQGWRPHCVSLMVFSLGAEGVLHACVEQKTV